MKRFMIKSVALIMTVVLLMTLILPFGTYAEDTESAIMPRWSIIYLMEMDIVFLGEGNGVVTALVTGQSNVTLLEGRVRLLEYVNNAWVEIGDYTNTSTYATLVIEENFNAVRGRDYKAYFYVTAHSEDDRERSYCKVEETCP